MAKENSIVLFATRSGHCKTLALKIAALLQTNAHEIIDAENRKGVFRFIKAGFEATTSKSSPIQEPSVDLKDVNTIVIVQPIWASSVLPPIRTYLQNHKAELSGKKLALFTSSKGTSHEVIKPKFEEEFGKLSACSGVIENATEDQVNKALQDFTKALLV